jgi:hypothetical protein
MNLDIDKHTPRFSLVSRMARIFATTAASILMISACAGGRAESGNQASSQPGGQDARAKNGDVVCHMERPVGSNIPERVCFYVGDIEAERHRTQTQMDMVLKPMPGRAQ